MKDSEFDARRRALLERMGALPPKKRADAILVTFLPNVRYLTGFTGSNGMLLLEADGDALFFTDPRYRLQSAREVSCRTRVCSGPMPPHIVSAVQRRGIRRLGFESARVTFAFHEFLREKLPMRTTLQPLEGLVESLRMVKSGDEIAAIRQSVQTNSTAFTQAVGRLRPGRTQEAELAAEIEYRMRRLGAEKAAFDTIVLGGAQSALPHARPSGNILQVNKLVLIDMGATQGGYASDMTRMLYLGRAGGKVKSLYRAVLEAQLAAIGAVRPGVTAARVDAAARHVLRAEKLDKAFVHSTGHGLGLEIHEPPRLGRKEKTRLQEGMAITIEPGAYVEGFCGVRIEDTVVVTRTGCEVLTPTPKELLEL